MRQQFPILDEFVFCQSETQRIDTFPTKTELYVTIRLTMFPRAVQVFSAVTFRECLHKNKVFCYYHHGICIMYCCKKLKRY